MCYPSEDGSVNGILNTMETTGVVEYRHAGVPPRMADRSLDKMTEATSPTTGVISKNATQYAAMNASQIHSKELVSSHQG